MTRRTLAREIATEGTALHAGARVHMADCLERSGRLIEALQESNTALEAATAKRDLVVARAAGTKLEKLLPRLGHVTFATPAQYGTFKIRIDDKLVTPERLKGQIVLDPGIGFGKTPEQSMACIARLNAWHSFGLPILVGASRKRFINAIVPSEPAERLGGSLAAHILAVENGAAIVRAHDVAPTVQALAVAAAIRRAR